jgi:pimeloyl-ACP methyl ester carboxylesterase
MGVQVLLEYYKMAPEIFRGIFIINGTSGNPFHTALNSPLSRYILPRVNELAKRVMPMLEPHIKPLAKLVIDRKGFVRILCMLGMTHERIRSDIIKKIATDMMETNLSMYHEIITHLAEHSAADVLPHIRVPTLIISGTRDIVTPSRLAEGMAEKIPGAELMIVNEGSHYTLLEFPDIVAKRLRRFLSEHFPAARVQAKASALRKKGLKKKTVAPRQRAR